jgi:hypothetical protein
MKWETFCKSLKGQSSKDNEESKRRIQRRREAAPQLPWSMLGRPNTPEEQEIEDILDALEKATRTKAGELTKRQEGALIK